MASLLSSVSSGCTAIGAVRSGIVDSLINLHQRFEAARRVVTLFRGGIANMALPLIPNLPAIVNMDLSAYNHIKLACPSLGLPGLDGNVIGNLPGVQQLEQLRVQYQSSVAKMLDNLESTPLGLIDQLESELNKKVAVVLKEVGPIIGVLDCVCAGVDEISNPANLDRAKSFYTELTRKPTLLDDELAGRMNTFREIKGSLSSVVGVNPLR